MARQFSDKVSEILSFSREEATRLASHSVGPEHLLMGILRDRDGIVVGMLENPPDESRVGIESTRG